MTTVLSSHYILWESTYSVSIYNQFSFFFVGGSLTQVLLYAQKLNFVIIYGTVMIHFQTDDDDDDDDDDECEYGCMY